MEYPDPVDYGQVPRFRRTMPPPASSVVPPASVDAAAPQWCPQPPGQAPRVLTTALPVEHQGPGDGQLSQQALLPLTSMALAHTMLLFARMQCPMWQ